MKYALLKCDGVYAVALCGDRIIVGSRVNASEPRPQTTDGDMEATVRSILAGTVAAEAILIGAYLDAARDAAEPLSLVEFGEGWLDESDFDEELSDRHHYFFVSPASTGLYAVAARDNMWVAVAGPVPWIHYRDLLDREGRRTPNALEALEWAREAFLYTDAFTAALSAELFRMFADYVNPVPGWTK